MVKRKPNILQGIAGFGTSYMMGTADGWSKLNKSEKDEFDGSFWNYMKRDRDGTQKKTAGNLAPVETPTGQSNPPQSSETETYTPSLNEMEDSSKQNNFGQSADGAPVETDGGTETYSVPSAQVEEKSVEVPSFVDDFLKNRDSGVDISSSMDWVKEIGNGS